MQRLILIIAMTLSGSALGDDVRIEDVRVSKQGGNAYHFDVTLRHRDTGWKHYADRWEVVSEDGKIVYGKRTLWHPHVNEQPFTRGLGGVRIPNEVRRVWVQAGDTVHGTATKRYPVELP